MPTEGPQQVSLTTIYLWGNGFVKTRAKSSWGGPVFRAVIHPHQHSQLPLSQGVWLQAC